MSQHIRDNYKRAAGEAMEQIKTFRWEVGGRRFGEERREEFQTMESGPTPPRVQNAVHPAQALGEGGNEHGMGHGPWVRGPLALAAHSAGHDLPPPLPLPPRHVIGDRVPRRGKAACLLRRQASEQHGVPGSLDILFSVRSALQEIERQRGPLLD